MPRLEFGGLRDLRCPECIDRPRLEVLKAGKVEIDRCPSCQGIWLDVGEFEAMLKLKLKLSGSRVVDVVDGVTTVADPLVADVVVAVIEHAGDLSKEAASAVAEVIGEILSALFFSL